MGASMWDIVWLMLFLTVLQFVVASFSWFVRKRKREGDEIPFEFCNFAPY